MKQLVYFAESCGKIKIGCSTKPPVRLLQIGEWIPFPTILLATMPGGYGLENAIHGMFDAEWSHGEWFHASPRLRAFVSAVAEGRPVAIDPPEDPTRRREIIADKKRVSRKLTKARASIDLWRAFRSVPGAMPIPDEIRERIDAFLASSNAENAA